MMRAREEWEIVEENRELLIGGGVAPEWIECLFNDWAEANQEWEEL